MRCLVIPDVHLQPHIFNWAKDIMESGQADIAVQLGDLVDSWGQDFNYGLYKRTIQRAKQFHAVFPDTLWCIGNHDLGYLQSQYGRRQTGFSKFLERDIRPLLEGFYDHVSGKLVHKIDDVLFSHAGITAEFAMDVAKLRSDDGDLIDQINQATPVEIWRECSPIWVRPQITSEIMYSDHLQVVGHTPVEKVKCVDNILSTDVFSTYYDGKPIGEQRFVIVDTEKETWDYADEIA